MPLEINKNDCMTENPYRAPASISELVLPPKEASHWRAAALLALIMTIVIRVPVPSIGVWIHFFVTPVSFVLLALAGTYGGDLVMFLSVIYLIFGPVVECQFYGGLIDRWLYRRRLRQFYLDTQQADAGHEGHQGHQGTDFVPGAAAANLGSMLVKAPREER
jgi:hypothetical protein